MIVVCTGHRNIKNGHNDAIRTAVRIAFADAHEMVFGGAIGFDMIALHEAWIWREFCRNPDLADYAKKKYPHGAECELVMVVPATIKQQPNHVQRQIEYYEKCLRPVRIIEMGLSYTAENLKDRNRAMVDRMKDKEGYVLAYYLGEKRSGTFSCIHYAESKKYPIRYISLDIEQKNDSEF